MGYWHNAESTHRPILKFLNHHAVLCRPHHVVPWQQCLGPGGGGHGQDGSAGCGAGITGTQAPSLLLWQWELEMQKAAHPWEEGAGMGSTQQQRPTHLRVHGTIPAPQAPGGR